MASKNINAKVLVKEKFLIVDNAIDYTRYNSELLRQIFRINKFLFTDFDFEYVNASTNNVFDKICNHKNLIVSTTFTTIKSNAIEDLLSLAIHHRIADKNIFSIMPFKLVGSDFENYKQEIEKLAKNNVHFYFISPTYSEFNKY